MNRLKVSMLLMFLTSLVPFCFTQSLMEDNNLIGPKIIESLIEKDALERIKVENKDPLFILDHDSINDQNLISTKKTVFFNKESRLQPMPQFQFIQPMVDLKLSVQQETPFFKNRRNLYSGLWTFASLNYLYADLVGVMDKNKLVQYQSGVVEGVKITPEFLTIAGVFMQVPISNVFLPYLIKNERTLKWVQIASGTLMTLVQTATLFVGKPTPYYVAFSAFEIAATSFITIDAIRWKPTVKTQP